MGELDQKTCVPCRSGSAPLTDSAIAPLLAQVPGWGVVEVGGVRRLERTYAFADFRQALTFTVLIGELAEREQHHPDLHLSWGKVRMETWTHSIQGLHENDFILAAKADLAYAGAAHA